MAVIGDWWFCGGEVSGGGVVCGDWRFVVTVGLW